jgi:hypothetical protein
VAGAVVGDSIGPQTEQAMRNLIAVLAEAGATPADVAKLTIILVEGVDIQEGFAASQKVWGTRRRQSAPCSCALSRGRRSSSRSRPLRRCLAESSREFDLLRGLRVPREHVIDPLSDYTSSRVHDARNDL